MYSGWRPYSFSNSAMMLSMFSCQSLCSSCTEQHTENITHHCFITRHLNPGRLVLRCTLSQTTWSRMRGSLYHLAQFQCLRSNFGCFLMAVLDILQAGMLKIRFASGLSECPLCMTPQGDMLGALATKRCTALVLTRLKRSGKEVCSQC